MSDSSSELTRELGDTLGAPGRDQFGRWVRSRRFVKREIFIVVIHVRSGSSGNRGLGMHQRSRFRTVTEGHGERHLSCADFMGRRLGVCVLALALARPEYLCGRRLPCGERQVGWDRFLEKMGPTGTKKALWFCWAKRCTGEAWYGGPGRGQCGRSPHRLWLVLVFIVSHHHASVLASAS